MSSDGVCWRIEFGLMEGRLCGNDEQKHPFAPFRSFKARSFISLFALVPDFLLSAWSEIPASGSTENVGQFERFCPSPQCMPLFGMIVDLSCKVVNKESMIDES